MNDEKYKEIQRALEKVVKQLDEIRHVVNVMEVRLDERTAKIINALTHRR